jgi:DNA helicase-2/ATP-dependent DNA helicase PcrA
VPWFGRTLGRSDHLCPQTPLVNVGTTVVMTDVQHRHVVQTPAGQLAPFSPVLRGLNKEQRAAVLAPVGPVIVLAGPGSGKTRVLTCRIGHMIESGIPPSEILAVTFTNKAAKEMSRRVRDVLGSRSDAPLEVTVGTFHGVCVRILREYGAPVGVNPSFSIFSGNQQGQVLAEVMESIGMDRKKVNPNFFKYAISAFKSQARGPDDVELSGESSGYKPFQLRQIREVFAQYEAELARSNALDFDDLLLRVLRLLQAPLPPPF